MFKKLSEMFSGSDNTSYGRTISFLALLFLLGWSFVLLWKTIHLQTISCAELRAAIPDIPNNWLIIVLAPYGISKGLQVAGTIFGSKKEGEA